MLEIFAGDESYDDENEKFVITNAVKLQLEHSLVSVSKWESKFKRAFLSDQPMTEEEVLYLLTSMCLTPNTPPGIFYKVPESQLELVREYLDDKQTATFFTDRGNAPRPPGRPQIVTSELIYYWMISYRIPIEAENWNFNRLITLIRIFDEKSQSANRKMTPKEVAAHQRQLNQQRRAASGSKG